MIDDIGDVAVSRNNDTAVSISHIDRIVCHFSPYMPRNKFQG
jgi:hypothetical protein